MDQLALSLKELAERDQLVAIYIATSAGELLMHVKGPQSAELCYIQQYLFGSPDEIKSSYEGLENMILPQMYAQGEDRAVYSKLGSLLYGVFYVGKMHVFEHWKKSKHLATKVEELIKNTSTMQPYVDG